MSACDPKRTFLLRGYSEEKSARYRLARISTSRSTYRHSAVLRSRRTNSSKASACSGAYSNQVKKSNGSPSSRLWCKRLATAGRYSIPIPMCRDCSSKMARRSSCAKSHQAAVIPDRNERGARRLRSQQHLLLNAQGLEFFSVCIARIAGCSAQNPATKMRSLRLWPFNHRKPFGRWKALTRNGSDPLNAPYPGRTGGKSNFNGKGMEY